MVIKHTNVLKGSLYGYYKKEGLFLWGKYYLFKNVLLSFFVFKIFTKTAVRRKKLRGA